MQAIEFETHLKNGLIRLPAPYRNWREGQKVKVIVLTNDRAEETAITDTPSIAPAGKNLNHHAGTITLTQDPLAFQESMRDEWT